MQGGRKMMFLRRSPSRWPISNRKVALSCLKLNSGDKKKNDHWNENFHKMPFRRSKRWNLAEKRWTSYGVRSLNLFPIEKLHQFVRTWILAQKKQSRAPKRKFWKKCYFEGRNDGIWRKNDEPPWESWLLTHFHFKSFTNLRESKFRRKKKRALKW